MAAFSSGSATGVSTAEVALANLQPMSDAGNYLHLCGVVGYTGNATASTVTIRVRQGNGTTGTVVYTSPAVTIGASATTEYTYDTADTNPGQTEMYTVTAQFSAAPTGTVTGTIYAEAITGNP